MEYVLGTEYMGSENVTKSGTPCESWRDMMDKMPEATFNFIDADTPSGVCRNPDGYEEGPYCYIKGGFIETCAIPSCCESAHGTDTMVTVSYIYRSSCSVQERILQMLVGRMSP